MINTNEKRTLEPRDREYLIHLLDTGYQKREPLGMHTHLFEEFDITTAERKRIILESDYGLDEDLVSTLVLFG